MLHTNPFARRYSHHVFLHREPHCLSDQPHVVQVAAVLALVCVWSAELHRRHNKHHGLLPHVAVLSPTTSYRPTNLAIKVMGAARKNKILHMVR